MSEYQARLIDVVEVYSKSELTIDHAAGLLNLSLYDTSDFDEAGGQLDIEGEIYTYNTKDDELNTIELSSALSQLYSEDTEVYVYPHVVVKEALIQLDEDDAEYATIPYELVATIEAKIQEGVGEPSVTVEYTGTEYVVKELLGTDPVLQGGDYLEVTGGFIPIYDDTGALRTRIGLQPDGTYTIVDYSGPALPKPEQPALFIHPGALIVSSYGLTDSGAPWPSDFDRLDIHVSSTAAFTPTVATKVGEFNSVEGGTITLAQAEGTYYCKLVAVSTSEIKSAPSDEVSATVTAPPQGEPGTTYYTWLKYADTPTSGMTDTPDGKTYMGIAVGKTSPTESNNYADYQWSLIQGPQGPQGNPGTPGVGVSGTVVTYAKNTSGTTPPAAGSFGASIPATTTGEFLWTRTVTTYTDSSTSTAYSVAAHGATGATGSQGPAGVGISGTTVTYQVGSSGTTAPTGTWLTSIPATSAGQYLWTRTVTTYTSGSPTTAYSVAAHGATGAQGIQGPPGPDGQPTYTWIKYATDASGTSMSDDPAGRPYIGFAYNKTTQTESTVPTDYTWSLIQGPQGPQGNTGSQGPQGPQGNPGTAGVSVTAVTPYFAQVATGAAAPAKPTAATPPAPWVATEPAFAPNTKLYRTEKITFSNATFAYTDVSLVSSYAAVAITAPASSPTPVVSGGIGKLYLDWAPVTGAGAVEYEVHMSTSSGFTPGAGTLLKTVSGTSLTASALPDGTPLEYDYVVSAGPPEQRNVRIYYFKTVAKNSAGVAAASTQASGSLRKLDTLDISVGAAWVGTMKVDQLRGGDLQADVIVGTGKIEARGVGVVGLDGTEGFYVKGALPPSGKEEERPPLIQFPVNGDPNIIAGQLTATTALIEQGVTLRGTSAVEVTAKIVLNGDIKAPKNAPILINTWEQLTLDHTGSGYGNRSSTKAGYDGTHILLLDEELDGTNYIYRFNPTTGAYVSKQSLGILDDSPAQVVYNPVRNCYHVMHFSTNANFRIRTYSSTWTLLQNQGMSWITNTFIPDSTIGVDHMTGALLITEPEINWAVNSYNTNTNGTIISTTPTAIYTIPSTSTLVDDGISWAYIAMGEFDYGVGQKKLVAKTSGWFGYTEPNYRVYSISGTTLTRQTTNEWPSAASDPMGSWWNPTTGVLKFQELQPNKKTVYTYEGGETLYGSGASKWWVGYSWYEAVGTPHESPLSPLATITMKKRAKLSATHDVPPGTGQADEPSGARIYLGKLDGSTAPTTANLFLRATTSGGLTTAIIAPGTNGAAATSKAADFPAAASPGLIESNSGGSYWRGDDTAKFLQLHLESTQDASLAVGNKPALRIGNVALQHLRIDGDEILSIASDNGTTVTQGLLNLNSGGLTRAAQGAGGKFQVGSQGSQFDIIESGSTTLTTNASGILTLTHSLNLGSYNLLVTSRNNGSLRHLTVTAKNANNATIRVDNHDGTSPGSGTNISLDYIILGKN